MFLHLATLCHLVGLIQGLSTHSCLLVAYKDNLSLDAWRCNATYNQDPCVVKDRQSLIHKFGPQVGNAIPESLRDAVCGAGEEVGQCLYVDVTASTGLAMSWMEWTGTSPSRVREAQVTDGVDTLPCPLIWQTEQSITNCAEAASSGVYSIDLAGSEMDVYCLVDETGHWTVIQRRVDATVDFYRGWSDYKNLFGDLNGNFWLGNDNIHILTSVQGQSRLRIDLEADTVYYSTFNVAGEEQNYTLTVNGYEAPTTVTITGDSMAIHDGMQFTTNDKDNDLSSNNCAVRNQAAWWYNDCFRSNLNGVYGTEIIWKSWSTDTSLNSVQMMVKTP